MTNATNEPKTGFLIHAQPRSKAERLAALVSGELFAAIDAGEITFPNSPEVTHYRERAEMLSRLLDAEGKLRSTAERALRGERIEAQRERDRADMALRALAQLTQAQLLREQEAGVPLNKQQQAERAQRDVADALKAEVERLRAALDTRTPG